METLGSYMKKAFQTYPDKIAVKYQNQTITYDQLRIRSCQLANGIKSYHLKKGDRVAVLMSNRSEHIESDCAAALGGFIKVPLDYRLHPKELTYIIENSGAKLLIGEKEWIHKIDLDIPKLEVGDKYECWLQRQSDDYPKSEAVQEDDVFVIMYTSGTTGRPKGGMLSHRNMIAGALSLALACEVMTEDVIGHAASLTHGSNFLSHIAWIFGLTQVVFNKFDPKEFIDDLEREKVSVLFLVPAMIDLMIQDPDFDPKKLGHVKSINMAGAPIAAAKLQKALELLGPKLIQTYGQVEAPMVITTMPRHELGKRLESCGIAGPFVETKVVDENGKKAAPGELGEVVCRGSLVMKGYWSNPGATLDTIKNGWLHTGDVGWMDEQGYLHLVDRKKDVVISGGMNIYPREIEEVLNKHDGVKETCVIGVPDDKWGERLIAYIVGNGTCEVTEEELMKLCSRHLAAFKKPKELYIVDRLPKSPYGKILKRELRKLYGTVPQ
ncbi:class I adenylate-forming enzyme family protein [Bacillus songklensis]|uniref:Class I adenylate-forming enzyme family protein n=1 Tax=Bacillus songklensis TaxID=1069116 RepID=A0ABV8B4Y9_9BACI